MNSKREYPHPQQYLDRAIARAQERYIRAIDTCGLLPNERLTRAIVEQAVEQASEQYQEEAEAILRHNNEIIEQQCQEQDNQLKKEGAKMCMWICPPIALLFGMVAWICFDQGSVFTGWLYAASLAFLGMLVYGWIFERPEK